MTTDPIVDFIAREFLAGSSLESLDEDHPLISSGIIDSVGTMRLVLFLEETYGILIDARSISSGALDSISAIRRLLADHKG
jgi:acyl carrier protein